MGMGGRRDLDKLKTHQSCDKWGLALGITGRARYYSMVPRIGLLAMLGVCFFFLFKGK